MKQMMMLVAALAVVGGSVAQPDGKGDQPEPFAHERRAALATDAWSGMRVDWTAVADWPTGRAPAAKTARTWIGERLGFHGFFVGNATSAACVKCTTFRKSDGKILGWDAFTDTNAVLKLVRELAKIQFNLSVAVERPDAWDEEEPYYDWDDPDWREDWDDEVEGIWATRVKG